MWMPGLVQVADDLDEGLGAAMGRDGQLAGVLVEGRLLAAVTGEDLARLWRSRSGRG